jgi:hypothetical protein
VSQPSSAAVLCPQASLAAAFCRLPLCLSLRPVAALQCLAVVWVRCRAQGAALLQVREAAWEMGSRMWGAAAPPPPLPHHHP